MAGSDEELELLLSFQNDERVPESPLTSRSFKNCNVPAADALDPRSATLRETLEQVFGQSSDDDDPPRQTSMRVFRDVVSTPLKKIKQQMINNGVELEVYSGLRIRNRFVSRMSLTNRLSDMRFVRLQAIRNAMVGDNLLGSWATIGVLIEKGVPRTSSTGKTFVIWKLASLDKAIISVFLFGDAYTMHWKEAAGSIFAVLNSKVRHDEKRNDVCLSTFFSDQLLNIGTSVDYCTCKAMRKDGTPCSAVINRSHGEYCKFHTSAMQLKFKTKRGELSGGKLVTGFGSNSRAGGNPQCSVIEELAAKPEKVVKHKTVKELKKVLSTADKAMTRHHSQGLRLLACVTDGNVENLDPKLVLKGSSKGKHGLYISVRANMGEAHETLSSDARTSKSMELEIEGTDDDILAQAMDFFSKKQRI